MSDPTFAAAAQAYQDLSKHIAVLEAALREAERALSVYAALLPTEYPGPPTTALLLVRAALAGHNNV